jgi:YggT family protein
MQDALTYLLSTVLDLYLAALGLRLALQWVRADFRNPMAQFILRVTNPVVLPVRRMVPAIGGVDTATVLVLAVIAILGTAALAQVACVGSADAGHYVILALVGLAHLALRTLSLLILVYVLMSWLGPGTYNPMAALLAALVEPVLGPLQRLIPPIGGLDVSPVVALIAVEFLNRLLPSGAQAAGLMCLGF